MTNPPLKTEWRSYASKWAKVCRWFAAGRVRFWLSGRECVRDNDELLDRWAGGYLPNRELREFFWHLDCCQQCREFVRDLVEKNLLSVPR